MRSLPSGTITDRVPCKSELTPRVIVGSRGDRLVLRLVANDLAFEVAQDDGVVAGRDQVVRHERNLAAAVRAVDDIGRDAQAGHVAAQALP